MNGPALRIVPLLFTLACSADTSDDGPATGEAPPVIVQPIPGDPGPADPIQPFTLPVLSTGMSRGLDGNLWFLAPGVGLIETSPAGQELSRIAYGSSGLFDYGFTDLAVLDDGSFALTSSNEAYRYRPAAQVVESYFCFVPESEPIVQENQAIAYDQAGGILHVAPARWDTSLPSPDPISVRLEGYTAADAAWQWGHDITATGILARGLSWDQNGDCLWVAAGAELHRFSRGGALEATLPLESVTDAQGVIVDGDRLAILDGATHTVHLIPRPQYF
jgi:hypothetical protein